MKPFECALCQTKFHNMCAGRRHAKKHHQSSIEDAQVKFVSCPELDKLAGVAMRSLDPDDEGYHPVIKDPNARTMSSSRRSIYRRATARAAAAANTKQPLVISARVIHAEGSHGTAAAVVAGEGEDGQVVTAYVAPEEAFVDTSQVCCDLTFFAPEGGSHKISW